jgi:hypothetical protein
MSRKPPLSPGAFALAAFCCTQLAPTANVGTTRALAQTPPPQSSAPAAARPTTPISNVQDPDAGLQAAADLLELAMRGFVAAIARRDVEQVLGYFSRRTGFTMLGTIERLYQRQHVAYVEFARDLRSRDRDEGWYSVMFDDEDESLAQRAEGALDRPWKRVGVAKFVPP